MKKIIFIADIHLPAAVMATLLSGNNKLKEQDQFLNIYPLI
ncbi:hypothetical protein [Chryseobacterium lathyri]|uniref:Calcineurin-like phosphoesterase domain-containing protein n=1 Tax=Chryseobacterium lathyri TaxID=395933 RepID=A0ABT9SQ26_9FLAO|nr:hypothetical protein [Chryseobacterium lathyri]MDP9960580.1 hypothetical protein [Chryseobacterium lathyri]